MMMVVVMAMMMRVVGFRRGSSIKK